MTRHRFFVPSPLCTGELIKLDKRVSQHIGSALRLGKGQLITLFTGDGGEFEAQISAIENKQVIALIGRIVSIDRQSPLVVRVAVALAKGDRMDYAIQKVTELGATHISPLFTERSEVRLSPDRVTKKMSHWQGIIVSACEQCGRNLLPIVDLPLPFQKFVENDTSAIKLILSPGAALIRQDYESPSRITLVSGPEGGFTVDEIGLAVSSGFREAGFGPRVLRAETAPVAALSVLQYLWGDAGDNRVNNLEPGPGNGP